MANEALLFVAKVHPHPANGDYVCRVLVDLVEAGDWRALQEAPDVEPVILAEDPHFLERIAGAAAVGGYGAVAHPLGPVSPAAAGLDQGGPAAAGMIHSRNATTYLWLHPSNETGLGRAAAEASAAGADYDAFLRQGLVLVLVTRSSATLLAECRVLPLAVRWMTDALADAPLPSRWDE